MRPFLLVAVAFVAVSSQPLTAFAQDADCPADAWFCSTDEAAQTESERPQPPPEASRPVVVVQSDLPEASPSPIVIIILPGRPVIHRSPPPALPRVVPRKPAPKKIPPPAKSGAKSEPKSENGWKKMGGFAVRGQRMSALGNDINGSPSPDASSWGGGVSLRIPKSRNLEFQVGNEALFGKDFNGLERGEGGISVHAVSYFNPDSRLRFYAIGGGMLGMGNITSTKPHPLTPEKCELGDFHATYGVLSGQAGFGAELRLASSLSVHFDALAAIRWRFASTNDVPEYFDADTGRATYTYPALLLRGGFTWWP